MDRRRPAAVEPSFPPHPGPLSLGERGIVSPLFGCFACGDWSNSVMGVIERGWTILPSPRGERAGVVRGNPSVAYPHGPINKPPTIAVVRRLPSDAP